MRFAALAQRGFWLRSKSATADWGSRPRDSKRLPAPRIHSPNTRRVRSIRISSAMLVRDSRTSLAKGAFGRHERQDSAGIRLVTAASRWRSSVRSVPPWPPM
jgi:hypothetical protein